MTGPNCAECGASSHHTITRYYGDGKARCYPKCTRKFEQRLNTGRNADGTFKENHDNLGWNGPSSAKVAKELSKEGKVIS